MATDQTYASGLAASFEAAGFHKTAITRWLASQFGLGVGTAIDKADEGVQKMRGKEDATLDVEGPPPGPPASEVPAEVIDTPEEAEDLAVQVVLEQAGLDPQQVAEAAQTAVAQEVVKESHTKTAFQWPWEEPDTTWEDRLRLGGGAAGALAGLGLFVGSRPSVRRSIGHWATEGDDPGMLKRWLAKKLPGPPPTDFDPESLRPDVQRLVAELIAQGVDPAKARIAVSGTGGTGKSTLARMLSEEMGMEHVEMDPLVRSMWPKNRVSRYFDENPAKPGHVYEQIRVLAEQDPDTFDAIVHLERPVPDIYNSLMQRGRAAWQMEVKDYPKTQALLRQAFDATEGAPIVLNDTVRAKVRPDGGFRADKILDDRLTQLGVNPSDRSRWSRIQHTVDPYAKALPGWAPEWRRTLPVEVAGTLGLGGAGGALVGDLTGEQIDQS